MLDEQQQPYGGQDDWTPSRYAIAFESFEPARKNARASRIVKHGTWPFSREIDVSESIEHSLYQFAYKYLVELDARLKEFTPDGLGLPAGWIDALDPAMQQQPGLRLRWRPIWPAFGQTSGGAPPSPMSWRLIRASDPADADPWSGTVILSAMETTAPNGQNPIVINKDIGVRVVVSLVADDARTIGQIRSMTAELPFLPFISLTEAASGPTTYADVGIDVAAQFAEFRAGERAVGPLDDLADDLQLDSIALEPGDFRVKFNDAGDGLLLELRGLGEGALASDETPLSYQFGGDFALAANSSDFFDYVRGRKRILSANAHAGETRVFRQDPASWREVREGDATPRDYDFMDRRPPRPDVELNEFRETFRISDVEEAVLETPSFVIRKCPDFVFEDDGEGTKRVLLPADTPLQIRSNDFTAVMAYYTAHEFYRIAEGVDIDLANLMVAAQPQVWIHYRSGIKPGPGKDGKTINARVSIVADADANLPRIDVHLALANLSRMWRDTDLDPEERWAQPLGMANAERWIWHEFGHVLIAARLGQLEFDFVHSIGDGISAVRSDPFSRVADRRGTAVGLSGTLPPNLLPLPLSDNFRGITFPWVNIPRRHDRNVTMGWAWGGSLNRSLLNAPEEDRKDQKGYVTEQILSTTLFRLYLILGGDTVLGDTEAPDFIARQRASAVTLFLVFEAMRTLCQAPSRAEAFEEAMEAADVTRNAPLSLPKSIALDRNDTEKLPVPWKGGAARKVVRWAFEAQGMYPPSPTENHNAPGNPPAVDIYIKDQRPLEEPTENGVVRHGPGGYVPVSLDWNGRREWQSDPDSLGVDFGPFPWTVETRIGNRGFVEASGIRLRWWWGIYVGDITSPDWAVNESITWFGSGEKDVVDTIPPGEEVLHTFDVSGEDLPQTDVGFILVVESSCPDDRANSDYLAGLACRIEDGGRPPRVPMELCDLVANDNNLGLRMFAL